MAKSHQTVRLAREAEAEALISLFCSGAKDIGLKPYVCSEESRSDLRSWNWLITKCRTGMVWIVNNGRKPTAMLVMAPAIPPTNLAYVVVDPLFRGMGLGPRLVRHIQSLDEVPWLCAEARNANSEHMLEKCGFERDGRVSDSGHPYMVWDKPPR